MENASKALLMAAGVLIGLLILSLAVYLFVSFGTTSAELHEQNAEQQIAQFNSQFISYVGMEKITIYDVVTVANLATETNIYYEFTKRTAKTNGTDNYISVMYNNKSIEKGYGDSSVDITNYYNQLISADLENITATSDLPQYDCKVEVSPTTNRVYLVLFTTKK